ncbi:MAG TPA: hypothetical protein VFY41_04665 [Nitrososphaeraceae archaeon]|nr:hypothetical protein [Nitrososphaeraceae archaeon]
MKLIAFSILIIAETLMLSLDILFEQTVLAAGSITTLQTNNDNYELYKNPHLKIKLYYPSDWEKFESDGPALSNLKGIVTFELSQEKRQQQQTIVQEAPIVSIIAEDLPSNNITLDQFIKIQHDNFRYLFSDFDFKLENKTAVIVGDNLAGKFEYTIVNPYSDGIRNGMVIWIIRGDTVYMISYVAEQVQYSMYLPTIEKLIGSIEFTNNTG